MGRNSSVRSAWKAALLALAMAMAPAAAAAQTGSITGRITDDKQAPVQGALLTVVGTRVSTTSNTAGQFTLVGFRHGNALFCRRQTGGLRRALELAGGRDLDARHVRCTEEGDAYCEWELRWA